MIRYRSILVLAAAVAALLYLGAWHAADAAPGVRAAGDGLAVPLDDAAIYFQYAKQALHGEWLRYSPGAALSTGVTSPLFFALLCALMGLGLSGPLAAWGLGALALLLGVVSIERLGRRLWPGLPAWWAPSLLLLQGAWVAWNFNGMETGLLLALSLFTVLAFVDGRRGAFLTALAALAFTRPEGQVLGALLALAWGLEPGRRQEAAAGLLLAAAPSALLFALSGGLVPDSLRPKSVALAAGQDAWSLMARASDYALGLLKGAWMGFWSGQDSVGTAGDASGLNPVTPLYPPLLLLAAVFGFFSQAQGRRRGLWVALAAALAGLAGLLSWQLPVGWHVHRYSAAAAPLLWLGALGALQALRAAGGLGRPAAAALFALWAAFGLASWPWHLQRVYQGARIYALSNRNAGLAMAGLPAGRIAVADVGLQTYYSGRGTVDLLGITDHALALAQEQGKGAQLEALLKPERRPRWAVLHGQRSDLDLSAWLALGLLRELPGPALGLDMKLFAWDWHGADEQDRPAPHPGWRVLDGLNVADLDAEAAAGYQASGPRAERSHALNLRRNPGGLQVPEGGREVLSERFRRRGQALRLRAVFDRPGRLLVRGLDGRSLLVAVMGASPSECYSEVFLPLPPDCPEWVDVSFEDEKGQPAAWTSCHYWFESELGR